VKAAGSLARLPPLSPFRSQPAEQTVLPSMLDLLIDYLIHEIGMDASLGEWADLSVKGHPLRREGEGRTSSNPDACSRGRKFDYLRG
jgi:hypothetical protein